MDGLGARRAAAPLAAFATVLAVVAAATAAAAGDTSFGTMPPAAEAISVLPPIHPSALELSNYPPVGQPASLTFTVTYGAGGAGAGVPGFVADRAEHPRVRLDVTGAGSDMYSVYNITSNIGTGAQDRFAPYDYAASEVRAEPGRTYTVRADIVIDREGVVPVQALGLDGDILTIYVDASHSRSMPYGLHEAVGGTRLIDAPGSGLPGGPASMAGLPGGGPAGAAVAGAAIAGRSGTVVQRSDTAWLYALAGAYRDAAGAGALESAMRADMAALGYGSAEAGTLAAILRMQDAGSRDGTLRAPDAQGGRGGDGGPLGASGGTELRGIVRASDYLRQKTIPVNGILVCAYDRDVHGGGSTLLQTVNGTDACTYTNNAGAYRIQDILRADPDGDGTTADLFAAVTSMGSDGLEVYGYRGSLYHYRQASAVVANHTGATLDVDLEFDAGNSGAARIIDAISDGRDFFAKHGVGTGTGPTVYWQHDAGTSAFSNVRVDLTAYWPNYAILTINGNSSRTTDDSSRWIILHEFAHHVQGVTGHLYGYCGLYHSYHLRTTDSCAWSEGVADLLPHLVDDSPVLPRTSTRFYDVEDGRVEDEHGRILYSPVIRERQATPQQTYDYIPRQINFDLADMSNAKHVGEKIEATVAAALWDMADANASARRDSAPPGTDGSDNLAVGAGAVVRAIFTGRPAFNMAEFYAKWEEDNIHNTSEPIMKLHSMGFSTPNRIPYYSISGLMWIGDLPTYIDYMNIPESVQVTKPDGTTVTVGSRKTWFQPTDIAVGPGGRIAVVDTGSTYDLVIDNFRLLGLNAPPNPAGDGTNIMVHVLKGFGDETCKEPPCVETTIGPLNHTDSRDDTLFNVARTGTRPSVAVDSQSRVIVPLATGHVDVFHPNGTPAFRLGDTEDENYRLVSPSRVAVDSNDRILVSDPENNLLKIFNPNGSLPTILRESARDFLPHVSHFRTTVNIATDADDNIVTARRGLLMVRVHEPNGDLRLGFEPYGRRTDTGLVPGAAGVAVDPLGRIIVASPFGKILSYEPTGRFIEEFPLVPLSRFGSSPSGAAIDQDGRLLVPDFHSFYIYAFELDTDMPGIHNVYYHRSHDGRPAGSRTVEIMVNFTEAVTVTGRPALDLGLDHAGRPAPYASGSGSPVLRFSYEVLPCDSADPLGYAGVNALTLNGGEIIDRSGNVANLTLPVPGGNGSLSAYRALRIGPATGACADAGSISAVSDWASAAHVRARAGPDAPAVSDWASAAAHLHARGAGPDAPAVSDWASAAAHLHARGAGPDAPAVSDWAAVARWHHAAAAGRPLLEDGASASLGYGASTGSAPAVSDRALVAREYGGVAGAEPPVPVAVFVEPPPAAPYFAGQAIDVVTEFSAPVVVLTHGGGAPYIELRTGSAGALAPYRSGNSTDMLVFAYEVRSGDVTSRLSYAGAGALVLNGSAIASLATGAPALSALPAPGEPGSLSAGGASGGGPPARIAPDPARPVLDIGILDEAGRAGGPVSSAALAAAYAFNERQGRTPDALLVNASVYDAGTTAGSAAAALRAAHAAGAGPFLYVGPSTDRGLHAAMPYADEHGIVLVSAGSTAPSLAVAGDRTFRLLPGDALEAAALARLAHNAGAESMHAVLENATYGPAVTYGVPPPQGRFSHGFAAALAYSGVPPLSGTVTLAGAKGAYEAAAAAAASLDASVRAGSAPAAVVYLGSPEGLAALAESSAEYPALASAPWFASGLSAGSGLLARDGGAPAPAPAPAAFAPQQGLSAVRWSPPATGLALEIDSLMPGADSRARHGAYAAYDAMLILGTAASAVRGALDAASVADGLPGAAAAYAGALGDIALDPAGDLWVPATYDLWTAAQAGQDGPAAWVRQAGAVDEARACSITLERARIDYGPIDSGQTSRPHLQTIANTGQLPFARVDLTATPWHVDSPGACAPGDLPSLPASLSEIRTEQGGAFSDLAASGTVLAQGLEAGSRAPLWYRLSLAGYADLPQAEITQCATYTVRCG